jgi:hypothetical protein
MPVNSIEVRTLTGDLQNEKLWSREIPSLEVPVPRTSLLEAPALILHGHNHVRPE